MVDDQLASSVGQQWSRLRPIAVAIESCFGPAMSWFRGFRLMARRFVPAVLGLIAAFALSLPVASWGRSTRHSCVPPRPHKFFKSLKATRNVPCHAVRQVLAVWNHQEFPPFIAVGFKWWEYRKYLKHQGLMYTLLHTSGHRNIYMITLPYG